jgi:hypothetical protein
MDRTIKILRSETAFWVAQNSVGVIVPLLFAIIPALRFPMACIASVFFAINSQTLSGDTTIGGRIMAGCKFMGASYCALWHLNNTLGVDTKHGDQSVENFFFSDQFGLDLLRGSVWNSHSCDGTARALDFGVWRVSEGCLHCHAGCNIRWHTYICEISTR